MYSACLLRFDINGYSKDTTVEQQYEMTQALIGISEKRFDRYSHFLSMRSYAGDEVVQTISEDIGAEEIFRLVNEFMKDGADAGLGLKGCVVLHPKSEGSAGRKGYDFENYSQSTLVCKDEDYEIMKKNNRGELGKFIGTPLILSARLLSLSKSMDKVIYADAPYYNHAKEPIYTHGDALRDLGLSEIRKGEISKAKLEPKAKDNLKYYTSDKCGIRLFA